MIINSINTFNIKQKARMASANATPTEKPSPKFLAQDTVSFSGQIEKMALEAALKSEHDIFQFLLSKSPNKINVNFKNGNGTTLLMAAVKGGLGEKCAELIELGAKVNAKDKNGLTAFHYAVLTENKEAIKALFSARNFNPNVVNNNGFAPIHIAILKNNSKILEQLLENPKVNLNLPDSQIGRTPLFLAVVHDFFDNAKILLEHGVDPNFATKEGYTALFLTTRKGNCEMSDLLIKYGANVNQHDEKFRTPLFHALAKSSDEMVEFLLKKGADVNAQNIDNETPLVHALEAAASKEKIFMLLKNGADPNIYSKDRLNAFHLAAFFELDEILEKMLPKIKQINLRDKDRRTALHYAAISGKYKCVEKLLEYGANPNLQDKEGNTVLQIAIDQGNVETIPLLFQYGAKKGASDSKGKSIEEYLSALETPVTQENPQIMLKKPRTAEQIAEELAQIDKEFEELIRKNFSDEELN